MRVARLILSFVLSPLFLIPSDAQQTEAPGSPPLRDPQGLAVINQCLVNTGGVQVIAALQDYTANGTITYYWSGQEVQVSATARGRGAGQFRLDANSPDGLTSLAASKGIGSVKKVDGSVKQIHYLNPINLGSLTFPFSKLVAALQDSSLIVSYLGLANESGRQAHRIQVRKNLTALEDPRFLRSRASIVEFFIDAGTLELLKTIDWIRPTRRSTIDSPHEVHFSDYRVTNGIHVPFVVSENIGGARLWTLRLTEISFNVGLKDSDFAL